MSRFADARADGTYRAGFSAAPVGPGALAAAMSRYYADPTYQVRPEGGKLPALLFDSTGQPLPMEAFRSRIDGGPGFPIQPRFPDSARPPRETQFSPGWNLTPTPRGEGGMTRFDDLRALALACWQFRVATNYRKNKMRGKKWEISPKGDKSPAARRELQDAIDAVTAFFKKPNRADNMRFGEWVDQLLEELLTVDATAFFKLPTKDGKELHSLVQIDGATIKLLIEEFGHVVGYQQILYGYPATQYPTYDPGTKTAIIRGADELAGRMSYIVTKPAVTNVYGTSTLEQLRPVIDIAIRRTARQLSWYQDGTVPDSFIEAAEGWVPEQIQQMQQMFNELYSGNERLRSQMTILPHGANYTPAKAFTFSKEESEEIISILCANEGIPRSIFTSQTNRATAEAQNDDAIDAGQKPLEVTLKGFFDDVIETDLAAFIPRAEELEFGWVDDVSGDELKSAQAKQIACGGTWRTVDEIRAEEGLDPMPEDQKPEAKAARMAEIMGKIPAKDGEEKPGKPGDPFAEKKPKKKTPSADEPAQKAELAAWEKFARKRVEKGKHTADFDVDALPRAIAELVVQGLKNASTDTEVRAVFAKAKEHLAAKRKSYEVQLSRVIADALERQKAGVLEVARKKLPEVAAA